MTNHSRVPSSLVEITSERIASSVARPPALRITWASPSARPAYLAGSSRASMQVRMAKRRAGGMASLPLSPKLAAYASLAASTSCKIGAMVNPSLEKLSIVQLFIPLPSSNSRNDDSSVQEILPAYNIQQCTRRSRHAARHVSEAQLCNRRDRHRYRQELVPRCRPGSAMEIGRRGTAALEITTARWPA